MSKRHATGSGRARSLNLGDDDNEEPPTSRQFTERHALMRQFHNDVTKDIRKIELVDTVSGRAIVDQIIEKINFRAEQYGYPVATGIEEDEIRRNNMQPPPG